MAKSDKKTFFKAGREKPRSKYKEIFMRLQKISQQKSVRSGLFWYMGLLNRKDSQTQIFQTATLLLRFEGQK